MAKKVFPEYYIGLDVGTSSVGWAVTDTTYRILNFNKKSMWGSVLFDEAQTAVERRLARGSRRRLERRKNRLKLLENLFSEAMYEVDNEFFMRLACSSFYEEDKNVSGKYAFFNDDTYNDKDYFKKYPTIYHLRYELATNNAPHDIRLVFLAIHHILKHRGHFVLQGDFSDAKGIKVEPIVNKLLEVCNEYLDLQIVVDKIDNLADVVRGTYKTSEKKELLKNILLNSDGELSKETKKMNKDSLDQIKVLLSGGTATLDKLYKDEALKEEDKNKLTFAKDFSESEDEYRALLEDRFIVIEAIKSLYDWGVLQNLLNGKTSLSAAKIESFEQHKSDLILLKTAVKDLFSKDKQRKTYKAIFGIPGKENANNYSAYIGNYSINGKNSTNNGSIKNCSREDFIDYLKKIFNIKGEKKDENCIVKIKYPELYKKLIDGTLLPKQKIKDNSIIPYQLHKAELKAILKNASNYLSFLNEVDDEGYVTKDKILSLLTFRVPYYVGPINVYHGKTAWAVRKEGITGKIYPWNFQEKIDYEESATKFIRRMTNKCSYIPTEDVLPKSSILYSKFAVLNELNNLRINNERIPVEVKKLIFEKVLLKNKSVTKNKIKNFLIAEGLKKKSEIDVKDIDGIDDKFNSTMASYIDFSNLLAEGDMLTEEQEQIAEECILNIVLFGADRSMLKKRLKRLYEGMLDEKVIRNIANKNYTGWGKLSAKFLTGIKVKYPGFDNDISIIEGLMNAEGNPNLMQLLSNDYDFIKTIEEYNKTFIKEESLDEMLEDMYISPSVKRSIHKTVGIMKELKEILGKPPKKIFIEMARAAEPDKGRSASRQDSLKNYYKAAYKLKLDWNPDNIKALEENLSTIEENSLRGDKLYLYYLQMGRCMYSGDKIDLNELESKYDIDHIYPRSYVKDDSISNRVLVKKVLNGKKSDIYPISEEIRNNDKVKKLWRYLLHANLMDKEKFYRLQRNTPFSLGELEGFINRQLVETRQSTKALAQVLQYFYPNTRIVYVKARNVSDFRHGIMDIAYDEISKKYTTPEIKKSRPIDNRMLKFRAINDFHHAKDAYLNIVVGNVYNTKFTDNPKKFIAREIKKNTRPYSLNAMYRFPCKDAWVPSIFNEKGELVEGTIAIVKKYMRRNNPLVCKSTTERAGELFDLNVLKKGVVEGRVPIKGIGVLSDMSKYGSYNKVKIAYYFIVESGMSSREITIECMPIMYKSKVNSIADLEKYCKEFLKLNDPKILVKKLKLIHCS